MPLNLTNLLKGHYSTEQNGLLVEDNKFIKWSHDGFGHISANLDIEALRQALRAASDLEVEGIK